MEINSDKGEKQNAAKRLRNSDLRHAYRGRLSEELSEIVGTGVE